MLINQCNRPMFHLTCRITLGMDIGDFLQFQCPLQCNREVTSPPKVKEITGVHVLTGDLFCLLIQLQCLLQQLWNLLQIGNHTTSLTDIKTTDSPTKTDRKQIESGQLGHKCLGGSNTYLWPGMGVNHPAGITSDG